MNKILIFVAVILFVVIAIAFQAWLVGIVLGIFNVAVTRGESIAVVLLFNATLTGLRALNARS